MSANAWKKRPVRWAALCAVPLLVAACATVARVPVPVKLLNKAQVDAGPQVRGWGDVEVPNIEAFAAQRLNEIRATRPGLLKKKKRTESYLALSGGGSNGAFGAGLLNGWSASGKRPEFEVVSGVSTGALMAPFVFLGPAYDIRLREIYTQYETKDLLVPRVLAGLTGGSAFSDTAPLQELIKKYIDKKVFAEIAREHARGRRLLVGTTNIDADRPVVWNMGRIAQLGTDKALKLFHSILLASASLPGLFPPVLIEVKAEGNTYQEMHVDGGTTENAFLLPLHFDVKKLDRGLKGKVNRQLYIIANDKTGPAPEATAANALSIAGRSITTLIKEQLEGDLIKLYLRSKENDIEYNLISIPLTFQEKSDEPFDKVYMGKLYQLGYELALKGINWTNKPPGI